MSDDKAKGSHVEYFFKLKKYDLPIHPYIFALSH